MRAAAVTVLIIAIGLLALPRDVGAQKAKKAGDVAKDEVNGLGKGAFLKAFEPDFYFDDQRGHIESARRHVAAGHVPFGVANLRKPR